MELQPFNWSVIILGHWNVAILAPARVAVKIFGLDKGISVPVKLPLDAMLPTIVEHPDGDINVLVRPARLEFNLTKANYKALKHAMDCAIRALEWLPETPVQAAGFNVNYKTNSPSPKMVKLCAKDDTDMPLADLEYDIINRSVIRTLKKEQGSLNLNIRGDEDTFEFLFNFHRDSKGNSDLIEWLRTPIVSIQNEIKKILHKFNLDVEDTEND